jgi:hypothetical protein
VRHIRELRDPPQTPASSRADDIADPNADAVTSSTIARNAANYRNRTAGG